MSHHNVQSLAWRSFCDALWMLGALAVVYDAGIAGWLTLVPLAAICALATWSAAVWLTKWKMSGWMVFTAMSFPFLLFFAAKSDIFWTWLYRVTNRYGAELTLLSPGGWTAAAFLGDLGKLPAVWWLVLAPLVVLAASAPLALTSLLRRLDPEEKLTATWLHAAIEENEDFETPGSRAKDTPVVAPSPTDAGFTGWWHKSPLSFADCGWMERLFLRWLSPRERLVLECSVSKMPRWTRWTQRSLLFLAVAMFCFFLLQHLSWAAVPLGFTGAISGIVGLCSGLPLASGFDQMVGRVNMYGVQIARPALLPVDPLEFLALTWKAAAIRGACMLPVLAAVGALLAWMGEATPLVGALPGVKLAILSVAAVPFFCVMAISSASNDSQLRGLRGVCSAGLVLLLTLILLALLIASFATPLAWAIPAVSLFALFVWGGARLYIRGYNRGRFDLLQTIRAS